MVPVKQVPQVAGLRFDPAAGRAVREGVPLVLNAYDRRALGEALRLRALLAGDVVALTMGPPPARKALEECLALGADRAIHLCDPALAGSDALATARALAAAIRPLQPDLVLCGQRSVDAETSQVGPSLAELLELPLATAATRITPAEDGRTLVVERLTDEGTETLGLPLPCLITAAERLHRPEAGMPPTRRDAAVETLRASNVGLAPSEIGAAGSTTVVRAIRDVRVERCREVLEGAGEAVVERIVETIVGAHGVRPSPCRRCWSSPSSLLMDRPSRLAWGWRGSPRISAATRRSCRRR